MELYKHKDWLTGRSLKLWNLRGQIKTVKNLFCVYREKESYTRSPEEHDHT